MSSPTKYGSRGCSSSLFWVPFFTHKFLPCATILLFLSCLQFYIQAATAVPNHFSFPQKPHRKLGSSIDCKYVEMATMATSERSRPEHLWYKKLWGFSRKLWDMHWLQSEQYYRSITFKGLCREHKCSRMPNKMDIWKVPQSTSHGLWARSVHVEQKMTDSSILIPGLTHYSWVTWMLIIASVTEARLSLILLCYLQGSKDLFIFVPPVLFVLFFFLWCIYLFIYCNC